MTYQEAENITTKVEQEEIAMGIMNEKYKSSFFWGYFRSAYIGHIIEIDRLQNIIKSLQEGEQ